MLRDLETPTNYRNQNSVESRNELDRTGRGKEYKRKIYEHICLQGMRGATCDELEQRLNIIHQTASCYVTVLKRENMIEEIQERRLSRFGRKVAVYVRAVPKPAADVPTEQKDLFQVRLSCKPGYLGEGMLS